METKQCRGCNAVLALSEFYKHPQMADGHLNHCKKCRINYTCVKHKISMQDPEWAAKERKRTRERNIRLGYAQKYKYKEASDKARKKWLLNNPLKRKAHIIIGNLLRSGKLTKKDCELCGASKDQHKIEAHHPDYSQPLVVMFLCTKCHKTLHRKDPL